MAATLHFEDEGPTGLKGTGPLETGKGLAEPRRAGGPRLADAEGARLLYSTSLICGDGANGRHPLQGAFAARDPAA